MSAVEKEQHASGELRRVDRRCICDSVGRAAHLRVRRSAGCLCVYPDADAVASSDGRGLVPHLVDWYTCRRGQAAMRSTLPANVRAGSPPSCECECSARAALQPPSPPLPLCSLCSRAMVERGAREVQGGAARMGAGLEADFSVGAYLPSHSLVRSYCPRAPHGGHSCATWLRVGAGHRLGAVPPRAPQSSGLGATSGKHICARGGAPRFRSRRGFFHIHHAATPATSDRGCRRLAEARDCTASPHSRHCVRHSALRCAASARDGSVRTPEF